MLARVINQVLLAYDEMEKVRIGNDLNLRSSKKEIFNPLLSATNDPERCAAIDKLANDYKLAVHGKHICIIRLLTLCRQSLLPNANYSELIEAIQQLKVSVAQPYSLGHYFPWLRAMTGDQQFDEVFQKICDEFATDLISLIPPPAIDALAQAQVQHSEPVELPKEPIVINRVYDFEEKIKKLTEALSHERAVNAELQKRPIVHYHPVEIKSEASFNERLVEENKLLQANLQKVTDDNYLLVKKLATVTDQLAKKDYEIQQLSLRCDNLYQHHSQYQQDAAEIDEYLQKLSSQFKYCEEEDKGKLKEGDIKKLVELAGADAVFKERYNQVIKAISDKIDRSKSAEHNKSYIVDQEQIKIYFNHFITAYDGLFRGTDASITLEEASHVASKAESMIMMHNAKCRDLEAQLANVKQSGTSEADLRCIDEFTKFVHLNKCKAAFFEELLKRAENLMRNKFNLITVDDLSERLGFFIRRNMPAIQAAVKRSLEQERKVASMFKPSASVARAPALFAAALANNESQTKIANQPNELKL